MVAGLRLAIAAVTLLATFSALGLLITAPVMMALWFAPALVVLRDVPAIDAMKLSFTGCMRNLWPFLTYSAIALVMLCIAALPLGLGLLVAAPVLIASGYTSYLDVYPLSPPASS